MEEWIDLTQPFYEGMPYTKEIKVKPRIRTIAEAEKDAGNVQEYTFTTHFGTHVDAPKHLFRNGKTIDEFPVERFIGEGVVLNIPKSKYEAITAEDLENAKPGVKKGDIVFIYTGWCKKYETEEYHEQPYLTEDAAKWLVDRGVRMVGIDAITLDAYGAKRPPGFTFPVHRLLLKNEIFVVENLGNLDKVAGKRVFIVAAPIKIKGADGAPARIIARVIS